MTQACISVLQVHCENKPMTENKHPTSRKLKAHSYKA